MYCKHCGSELKEHAVVCVNCGCSVDNAIQNNKSTNNEQKIFSFSKVALILSFVCLFPLISSTIIMADLICCFVLSTILFSLSAFSSVYGIYLANKGNGESKTTCFYAIIIGTCSYICVLVKFIIYMVKLA